jgi:hypothetical protein
VDILLTCVGLVIALVVASWSCARSYFESGRFRGAQEATCEILRGITSHYEMQGQDVPEIVAIALKKFNSVSDKRRKMGAVLTDPYHAQLWILGDAVGEACWLKGHAAGMKRKAPGEGKIRVDLTLNELLHLSWLAHLGFQNMMPNFRGFEIHRFDGEADAQEGAKAVSRIEAAIPTKERPFADLAVQLQSREKLISDWWQPVPKSLTA